MMPTTHRTLFPPPDERRALEQLERLHHEIQKERRQRERAAAEFDRFIGSFDAPGERAPQTPATPTARQRQRAVSVPVHEAPLLETNAAGERPELPDAARKPGPVLTRRGYIIGVAAAAVVVSGAGIYVWRAQAPSAQPGGQADRREVSSPPPATAPGASGSAASPQGIVSSPSTVQLTAVRPVWLRVTVDGKRVVERELKAGERLSFTPANAVSIRAGNGGAVRVKVGNAPEESLGAEGEVLTRLIRPASSPRSGR